MSSVARWMDQALALAVQGLGNTWPNPAVGCVITRDDQWISEGWTQPGGRPHAEIQALQGVDARGATAYVTLEPCAHTGQTGPCARALAEAGIARVVMALDDPDPRVAGQGRAMLEAAGVTVETGLRGAEAAEVNKGYLSRLNRGRPWITLKLASSLDGRIALATGESRWITGPDARAFVHQLRATSDAILIGAGTARADNPILDVREGATTPRPPVRIVTDPGLSLPPDGRLAQTAKVQPLWLLHGPSASNPTLGALGATLLPVPVTDTGLDLPIALQTLGAKGLTRILCEGGGQLAASLVRDGLVDELILITAGKVIGAEGTPVIGPMAAQVLAKVPHFKPIEHRQIGDDILTRWVSAATNAPTL